jgi:hypothetical protein
MSTFIDGNLDPATALHLLTMQDAAYRGMADNWPKPRWCKFLPDGDSIFIMVWMNRACAERFYGHCSPYRVIGHCDRVCWNDECAGRYAATDRAAVERAGEIIECREPVQGNGEVRVIKFAFRAENEQRLRGWFVYGECPDE